MAHDDFQIRKPVKYAPQLAHRIRIHHGKELGAVAYKQSQILSLQFLIHGKCNRIIKRVGLRLVGGLYTDSPDIPPVPAAVNLVKSLISVRRINIGKDHKTPGISRCQRKHPLAVHPQILPSGYHREFNVCQIHFFYKLLQIPRTLRFGDGHIKRVCEPGEMRLFILEHGQIISVGRAYPEINFFIHFSTPIQLFILNLLNLVYNKGKKKNMRFLTFL